MAIKIQDVGYACNICGRIYKNLVKAPACRDTHDTLYIPMSKTELNRLINGLILNDVSLVPDSLLNTLRKYQKAQFRE